MNFTNELTKYLDIINKLQDEESRIIFEARIKYFNNRNENDFYKEIDAIKRNYYCTELDDFLSDNKENQGIILFGTGIDGIRTKRILEHCNKPAKFFCDSNSVNSSKKIEGLSVLSIDQLVNDYSDYIVILTTKSNLEESYRLLLRSGFPRKQILLPMHGYLIASHGWQYYDVFQPIKDEIYVDVGAYNGDTIRDFIEWTDGVYNKVYAFEPNVEMINYIRSTLEKEQIKNVNLIPNASWSKKEILAFKEDSSASRIETDGNINIQAVDIDSVVGEDKITYIKMDVEGSELQSLIGAQKSIKLNKPRLAISLYHNPEDIIEIPRCILELMPDYKFYIRHYNTNMWETILYAF